MVSAGMRSSPCLPHRSSLHLLSHGCRWGSAPLGVLVAPQDRAQPQLASPHCSLKPTQQTPLTPLLCTLLLLMAAPVGASQLGFAVTLGNLLSGPRGETCAQQPQPAHPGTGEGAASFGFGSFPGLLRTGQEAERGTLAGASPQGLAPSMAPKEMLGAWRPRCIQAVGQSSIKCPREDKLAAAAPRTIAANI